MNLCIILWPTDSYRSSVSGSCALSPSVCLQILDSLYIPRAQSYVGIEQNTALSLLSALLIFHRRSPFVRSLFRSVPLSHPISNCAHSESECDFALDFTTGRERMKLQGLPLIPNEWHRFMSYSKTRARRTHHRCRKLSPGPSFSKCDIKVGKINYLYRVIYLVMEHCLLTSN